MEERHDGNKCRFELFMYSGHANAVRSPWEDIPEVGCSIANEHTQTENHQDSDAADRGITRERSQDATANEITQSFEAGRKQGIAEGRAEEMKRQDTISLDCENKRIEHAAKLSNQFLSEQSRLLQSMEHEVVKLALAIAARILRREAQTDPLFLIGAVRVALGQLADTMQVRLHIPSSDTELWSETIRHIPNLKVMPTLVPDAGMRLGDCVIETEMGSVDLSFRAQLLETERTLLENSAETGRKVGGDSDPSATEGFA